MPTLLKPRVRKSASERFEAIVKPYFDALYSASRRYASSPADAEDLVQEVCMKAYLNLDKLEQMEHKRAWLIRVLHNLFIDGQRSRQRSPLHIAENSVDVDQMSFPQDAHLQPEEQVERVMRVDIVLRAMALLDKEQCSLLTLHDIEGLSLDELHAITDIPIGTIKSRLFRSRVKLGRLLKNEAIRRPRLKVVGGKG
jgi:RNA polymerase sigma-70 factor (ECF subfamily)